MIYAIYSVYTLHDKSTQCCRGGSSCISYKNKSPDFDKLLETNVNKMKMSITRALRALDYSST